MTNPEPLTDEELDELDELARAATPGPWFVQGLDDVDAMSLVAVTTVPDTGPAKRWPDFDHREIVAATLVQQPAMSTSPMNAGTRTHTSSPPPATPCPSSSQKSDAYAANWRAPSERTIKT